MASTALHPGEQQPYKQNSNALSLWEMQEKTAKTFRYRKTNSVSRVFLWVRFTDTNKAKTQKLFKAFFCDFRWLSTLHATMWKIVLVLSQVQYFLTEPIWWHRCDCYIGKPVVYISLMSALIRKMNPLCISDLTHVSWPDYTETSTECVAVMPGGPQYMFFLNFDFVPKTLQRNHSQLFMIFYQALPRHLFRKSMLGTFSLEFNCQIYFPPFTIKNQSAEVWEWHFQLDYSREITDVSH